MFHFALGTLIQYEKTILTPLISILDTDFFLFFSNICLVIAKGS